eukprot:g47135.t1
MADQTRPEPDQNQTWTRTGPDQTRPDQTRPDQTSAESSQFLMAGSWVLGDLILEAPWPPSPLSFLWMESWVLGDLILEAPWPPNALLPKCTEPPLSVFVQSCCGLCSLFESS